jgi:hypothetical protein
MRADFQSAGRFVAQKFLAIFCGAGSAHPPEHSRKVLLRFEAACYGDIQDSRFGAAQHLLCTLYFMT